MCIRDSNGTFRGYQLSLVAAKAGLEFMLNEHVEDAVRERAPFVEKFLKENIETIDSRITTRGIGLPVSYTHLDVYKRQVYVRV